MDKRTLFSEVTKPLQRLGDGYFSRGQKLLNRGWTSFLPVLNSTEEFLATAEEVAELERFETELCLEHLGRYSYASEFWRNLQQASIIKNRETGDFLDLHFPAYNKRVKRMMSFEETRYTELRGNVISQVQRERNDEMQRHCLGCYKDYAEGEIKNRLIVYKRVMSEALQPYGFELDKSLSIPTSPVFAKAFLGPWKLAFSVDKNNLNEPVLTEGVNTGIVDVTFGLVHETNRGVQFKDLTKVLPFSLCKLFPVARYPFIPVYMRFTGLQELELIVLAHVAMYGIISSDFEALLEEGISNAVSKGVRIMA